MQSVIVELCRPLGARRRAGDNVPSGYVRVCFVEKDLEMQIDRSAFVAAAIRHLAPAVVRCVLMALGVLSVVGWSAPSALAAAKRKPSVLIVHAQPDSGWVADVTSKLQSSGQFSAISATASGATPTLATLLAYDGVLLFSDDAFGDKTSLGNNLADYVDAGGGVVSMVFSTVGSSHPEGRWNPGYFCMLPGGLNVSASTLDLASITDQNHPILIGVGSFDGGSSSYRSNQNSVVAGATVVARWTGGNVLVAAGPLPGRVDLNFFPVSNTMRADLWQTSTDGVKLMVNSLLAVMRPRVLIAGNPNTASWNDDVKAKIRATGVVGITDIFNIGSSVPTLAQLQAYDSVLVYTDSIPTNTTALGNVFADYVDAGGGVVKAAFAVNYDDLGGRWVGAYDLISITGTVGSGSLTSLGTVMYPSHPAMRDVVAFNGGSSSYQTTSLTLNPGAFNIAQWSNGRPLVVASTKFSNRLDLNFYPPSSTVRGDLWSASTDGGKLMANALVYVCKPYVACVAADTSLLADPVAKLAASRRFSGVLPFNAAVFTPPGSMLRPFNAVLTWSNNSYNDTTAMGNNLADFVDAGAGVVTAMFANVSFSTPQGRWPTQGYEVVPSPLPGLINGPQAFLGAAVEPANPINTFVRKFDGGTSSFRPSSNPLLRGREVLRWSDGRMLASVHNFRKRVDLGMYPASSGGGAGNVIWNQRTDGTWLMANALEYSVYHKPCPGDLNGDGSVDDADFVFFAGYYDTLVDPRGDLNGDGITEDSDFVIFANGYDTLVCP